MKFILPDLPYEYGALEPHLDAKTMEIHHGKHHQAYVDKLNAALADFSGLQNKTVEDLLAGLGDLPDEIKTAVKNNGGGHFNHSFFWEIMSPEAGRPEGALAAAVNKKFGDPESFKQEFSRQAANFFGSGWMWLVIDKKGEPEIMGLPNHDCPVTIGLKPLLVLDLWEHAYYLKYQNRRAEYIKDWWNVVNWKKAGELFTAQELIRDKR